MSIETFIVKAESTAVAALKQAGTIIENFFVSEGEALLAQTLETPLGTTAMNLIQVFENHDGTGVEKFEMLVGAITPALQKLKDAGGLPGLVVSVENFARAFAQQAYNRFKAAAVPLLLKAADEMKGA